MSTTSQETLTLPAFQKNWHAGPLTTARLQRTAALYAALWVIGLAPAVLGWSAGWQAAGVGLIVPGGGFLAVGGWAMLLFPLTALLFFVAVVAWFASAMVPAPLLVWFGSAAIAGLIAGDAIWPPGAVLAGFAALATIAYFYQGAAKKRATGAARAQQREQALPQTLAEVRARAVAVPAPGTRELSADDLQALRYGFDRALQPVDRFDGFNIIDQFQTSAVRYQINHLGYALALLQTHYTPSFHGYQVEAQRNLIEKYLLKRVWSYWTYETAWGHLNWTNFDPVAKDNIMLTAWFGLQVGLYTAATGDRRYVEPGSLPFRRSDKVTYQHGLKTLADNVAMNYRANPFCLFPCEPNWIYPICNHYGMSSLTVMDQVLGTSLAPEILDRWLHQLDTEFTDASGSVIGLRSSLTGLPFPFPGSETGFAGFENTFAPHRAERMWAIARMGLQRALVPDAASGEARLRLPGKGIDFGNYRRGFGPAYGTIMQTAREFGDEEMAAAAERSLRADCRPVTEDGVLRYATVSNMGNIAAMNGRIRGRDDFRNAVTSGPPEACLRGPVLASASYPDVLVARAYSGGDDLQLVLHPGREQGVAQPLRFARLRPNARYELRTGQGTVQGSPSTLSADLSGEATTEVRLDGRTELHLVPASA